MTGDTEKGRPDLAALPDEAVDEQDVYNEYDDEEDFGPTPALQLVGISKAFGPVQANKDISISVHPCTIHEIIDGSFDPRFCQFERFERSNRCFDL